MTRLPPMAGRVLALLLLAALVALVWTAVVVPLRATSHGYRQEIARSQEMIERFRRVGATREALQQQRDELRRRGRSSAGYLEGASHSLAAAALQERIKRIVTRNGGTVRSAQPLPPQEEQGLMRVPVRVQITTRIESLQRILYALETDTTYLFFNDLSVRTRRVRPLRRGTAAPPDDRTLSVSFELYGYHRPDKS